MLRRVTPDQAAYVMGCSTQFIRIGLQKGLLDIGNAVKMSTKWTYNISPAKLAARQGMTMAQLEMELRHYRKAHSYDCQSL